MGSLGLGVSGSTQHLVGEVIEAGLSGTFLRQKLRLRFVRCGALLGGCLEEGTGHCPVGLSGFRAQ